MKKYLLITFFILMMIESLCANIAAIDLNKLPSDENFSKEVAWVTDNQYFIATFWPEWTFKVAKKDLVVTIKKILNETNVYIKADGKNIELLLFRVLLYNYLYNLSSLEYDEMLTSEAIRIKKLFPDEYRIYWLLGKYYDMYGFSVKSIAEFDYVVKNTIEDRIAPYFWYDYAAALGQAGMIKHGIATMQKYAGIEKKFQLKDSKLYQIFTDRFIPSDFDAQIPYQDIYSFQERENTSGVMCRLFGLFLPLKKNWDLQLYDIKENIGLLMFSPEAISDKNNQPLKYAVYVGYSAHNKVTFDKFVENALSKYIYPKKRTIPFGKYQFRVYEITDPKTYASQGGAHGYILFLSQKEPKIKGFDIEAPIITLYNPSFPGVDPKKEYTPPSREYDRYDGDIYYTIFLDCSEDAIEKALEAFKTFTSGLIFD